MCLQWLSMCPSVLCCLLNPNQRNHVPQQEQRAGLGQRNGPQPIPDAFEGQESKSGGVEVVREGKMVICEKGLREPAILGKSVQMEEEPTQRLCADGCWEQDEGAGNRVDAGPE